MRPLILITLLLIPAGALCATPPHESCCARCYGADDCHACKNCNYCANCNSGGTKCGVWKRLHGVETHPASTHKKRKKHKAAH